MAQVRIAAVLWNNLQTTFLRRDRFGGSIGYARPLAISFIRSSSFAISMAQE
jgi:hypothetical protein